MLDSIWGLVVIKELRRKFQEPGDLAWRSEAIEAFKNAMLDAPGLLKYLKLNLASDRLTKVK